MGYQLQATENNSRGRKKGVGSLMRLGDGRIGAFVGYCPSDTCSSKICMDFETARSFSQKYHRSRKRFLNRVLVSLLTRLESATQ